MALGEPGVQEGTPRRRPLVLVLRQEALQEGHAVGRHPVPGIAPRGLEARGLHRVAGLRHDLLLIAPVEGVVAEESKVQHDSSRPDVHLGSVERAVHVQPLRQRVRVPSGPHLRCAVLGRAADQVQLPAVVLQELATVALQAHGQAEVNELDGAAQPVPPRRLRQEQILSLDITVDNTPLVQVLERLQQLSRNLHNIPLSYVDARRGDRHEELTAPHELHHNIEKALAVEDIQDLDDMRVPQCRQNVSLLHRCEDGLALLHLLAMEVDYLNRVLVVHGQARLRDAAAQGADAHLAKAAGAKEVADLVLLEDVGRGLGLVVQPLVLRRGLVPQAHRPHCGMAGVSTDAKSGAGGIDAQVWT
mmetsp:Transcript_28752/g.89430  ORF Transcript_28752/g.89430 Transcript_28752/m.89430 type:complete len:360 (-) Transcript_28752:34-1113(-)